jgi:hypothetical protein
MQNRRVEVPASAMAPHFLNDDEKAAQVGQSM